MKNSKIRRQLDDITARLDAIDRTLRGVTLIDATGTATRIAILADDGTILAEAPCGPQNLVAGNELVIPPWDFTNPDNEQETPS